MKITAPGVYDIEIERYHHDPNLCDGPSISASGLRTILSESPAHYWAFSPYNPNRFRDETTKALDIGRAAHSLVLGEPEFREHFIISPYDDFRTKEAREWRDAQTRTVLKADEFATIEAVAAAQRRSPQCMRAFEHGKPEQSLIYRDKETGVYVKSRPDWLPDDPATRFIAEFKTARSIDPRKWSSDAFAFGYDLQIAMQIDGVREVMGIAPLGVAHVVQEKDAPYLCELRMFTDEHVDHGRFRYRRALRIFAECMNSGEWPGFTSEPTYVETPYWYAKLMEGMRNDTGTLDRSGSYSPADYLTAG